MKRTKSYIEREFYALGTINYIKINDCLDEDILNLAVNRVYEIEQLMSVFLPDSDISRINSNAGNGFIQVHKDTYNVLKLGHSIAQLSDGAFDLTMRPLVELWGIGKKNNYIPSKDEITRVRKLVNYKDLLLDEANTRAALRYPGQSIDLGGIAKGYAADEIRKILINHKVCSAMINLGGNVFTIGGRSDGSPWQIGIQNPLASTGKHLGILSLEDKTIVTSGCNERFFIKNGIRYHHILDSKTGSPASASLLSVTVIGDCSMIADALTTALFVLGIEKGLSLLKQFRTEALFITDNLGLYTTEGLKDYIQLKMEVSNEEKK